MISIRFETPGFAPGSWRTSRPESVRAVLNFFLTTWGGSIIRTTPSGLPAVVDISLSGSWRFLILAPSSGKTPRGIVNVSP